MSRETKEESNEDISGNINFLGLELENILEPKSNEESMSLDTTPTTLSIELTALKEIIDDKSSSSAKGKNLLNFIKQTQLHSLLDNTDPSLLTTFLIIFNEYIFTPIQEIFLDSSTFQKTLITLSNPQQIEIIERILSKTRNNTAKKDIKKLRCLYSIFGETIYNAGFSAAKEINIKNNKQLAFIYRLEAYALSPEDALKKLRVLLNQYTPISFMNNPIIDIRSIYFSIRANKEFLIIAVENITELELYQLFFSSLSIRSHDLIEIIFNNDKFSPLITKLLLQEKITLAKKIIEGFPDPKESKPQYEKLLDKFLTLIGHSVFEAAIKELRKTLLDEELIKYTKKTTYIQNFFSKHSTQQNNIPSRPNLKRSMRSNSFTIFPSAHKKYHTEISNELEQQQFCLYSTTEEGEIIIYQSNP